MRFKMLLSYYFKLKTISVNVSPLTIHDSIFNVYPYIQYTLYTLYNTYILKFNTI